MPSDKLKVSLDFNDRNNYMPVAMHPTEVQKKAREFSVVPAEIQEDSIESENKPKSESVHPSPSFRQPDLPFSSDNPKDHSRHRMMLLSKQVSSE